MSPVGTPLRTIRVSEELWQAAKTLAKERGENLSDIIRECLKAYIDKWGTK